MSYPVTLTLRVRVRLPFHSPRNTTMPASPTNSSHLDLEISNSPRNPPIGSPKRVTSDVIRNGPWTTQALLSKHTLTELLPPDHRFAVRKFFLKLKYCELIHAISPS